MAAISKTRHQRAGPRPHKAGGRQDGDGADRAWFWCGLIVVAGVVAFANSFSGEFVFDDTQAIVDNQYVRRLWPLTEAMSGPAQSSVSGRPMVSLSLAVNYAIGGLNVWGYHLFNLAVHLLAGLALFGIVRRTVSRSRNERGNRAAAVAGISAIIWVVHPLQTESVTYVIQRAEALMGLFYLATLYCFVRATEQLRREDRESQIDAKSGENRESTAESLPWLVMAILSCALGMATKEVMATAPLMVLLYDRIFVARSWREIVERRKIFYVSLFATWAILAALVIGGPRSESAGFGLKHASPLDYALTQFGVILYYLKQIFWPDPLCLDWYWMKAKYWWQIYPQMLAILLLLAATGWAMWTRPRLGYLGAWFFVILGPTSSIVPIADLSFEHRVYLPMAGVVVLSVLLATYYVRRLSPTTARASGIALAVIVVGALTARTIARNADYHDGLKLWEKTVRDAPWNPRAYTNVCIAHLKHGQKQEAIAAVEEAIRIDPGYADAYRHLGKGLGDLGDWPAAAAAYKRALAIEPDDYKTLNNYASALQSMGDVAGAIEQFEKTVAARKDEALSWYNLGLGCLAVGRNQRAVEAFEAFLAIGSRQAEDIARNDDAKINLGIALQRVGRTQDAINHYQGLIAERADWVAAHYNLALAWTDAKKPAEAMAEYGKVIALAPGNGDARCNLGILLKQAGRIPEAEQVFRESIRVNPGHVLSLYNLGTLLAVQKDREKDAVAILEEALRIAPHHEPSRQALQFIRQHKP